MRTAVAIVALAVVVFLAYNAKRAEPPARAKAESVFVASGTPDRLTLAAYPWARVTEGDRVVCPMTPCMNVRLPVGEHRFTLERYEEGRSEVRIDVTPGGARRID